MPFKSQAQAAYLFKNAPTVAKEFASKTPSVSSLPHYLSSAKTAVENLRKRKK